MFEARCVVLLLEQNVFCNELRTLCKFNGILSGSSSELNFVISGVPCTWAIVINFDLLWLCFAFIDITAVFVLGSKMSFIVFVLSANFVVSISWHMICISRQSHAYLKLVSRH